MNEFTLLRLSDETLNVLKNNERLTQVEKQNYPELTAPDKSVDFILNYSKTLSIRRSQKLGHIENLLN